MPYACDQGIKALLQIIFSWSGLPPSSTEMKPSQRQTNVFVSGPSRLCGTAVKCSTAAVLQLRNGWCLEKVSLLAAYKENKALECFRGAAVWKCKLLFSHHSLLPMIQHSKPDSEYLPVTVYANMHRHVCSREYLGLIRKETHIYFVF